MSQRSRYKSSGSSFPKLTAVSFRMDQPSPSSRNAAPHFFESPESPNSPENFVETFSQLRVKIPLGIDLASSSADEYEEPSSKEDENNVVPDNPAVDYGYDEDWTTSDITTILSTLGGMYLVQTVGGPWLGNGGVALGF